MCPYFIQPFYILSANLARNVPMLQNGVGMNKSKYQTFSLLFNDFGKISNRQQSQENIGYFGQGLIRNTDDVNKTRSFEEGACMYMNAFKTLAQ